MSASEQGTQGTLFAPPAELPRAVPSSKLGRGRGERRAVPATAPTAAAPAPSTTQPAPVTTPPDLTTAAGRRVFAVRNLAVLRRRVDELRVGWTDRIEWLRESAPLAWSGLLQLERTLGEVACAFIAGGPEGKTKSDLYAALRAVEESWKAAAVCVAEPQPESKP